MALPEFIRLTNLDSSNVPTVIDTNDSIGEEAATMLEGVAGYTDSFNFTGISATLDDPEPATTTVNFSRFTHSEASTGSTLGDIVSFLEAWQYAQQIDAELEAEGLEDVYAFAFRNEGGGFEVGVLDVVSDPVETEPVDTGFFGFGLLG